MTMIWSRTEREKGFYSVFGGKMKCQFDVLLFLIVRNFVAPETNKKILNSNLLLRLFVKLNFNITYMVK